MDGRSGVARLWTHPSAVPLGETVITDDRTSGVSDGWIARIVPDAHPSLTLGGRPSASKFVPDEFVQPSPE